MILISAIKPVRFKIGRGKEENLPSKYIDGFVWFTTDTGRLYIDAQIGGTLQRILVNPELDWSQIKNKPEIPHIYYNTKEYWDSQLGMVGEKDAMYVYTNASQDSQGKNLPSIKIGDGSAYLIDTPFIDSIMMEELTKHINDTEIHVSAADRARWDNKVRVYSSAQVEDEQIIFTTD